MTDRSLSQHFFVVKQNRRQKKRKQRQRRRAERTNLKFALSIIGAIIVLLNVYTFVCTHFAEEKDSSFVRSKTIRLREKVVSSITLQSLPDLTSDVALNLTMNSTRTSAEASRGKEPILALLRDAGINDIDVDVVRLLPTLEQVRDIYGTGPTIEGLHQCEAFRGNSLGIAGMFDSGTNLAADYLEMNCDLAVHWQVPWGKHVLAERRKNHVISRARKEDFVEPSSVLPVVLIRDPYFWMQSMCHHNYGAQWFHSNEHCPNLVPNDFDFKMYPFRHGTVPVRIKYDYGVEKWDSLAHLWSAWYRQYHREADYPRLMVRYEDFLFHPKQVTQSICECAGGNLRKDRFRYAVNSAKYGPGHGTAKTSWVSAMIRYGRGGSSRIMGMTVDDLKLAKEALELHIMEAFSYIHP